MRILSDAQYVPQATPVYSHPLLRTAKTSAAQGAPAAADDPLTSDLHAAPTSDNGHADIGGVGDAPEFLDPLGAFASTVDSAVATKDASANGTSAKGAGEQPTTFADPLVAGRLGNTLREESGGDEVPDLDPKLIGFRPWTELKSTVLVEFTTNDKLSLETSFLTAHVSRVQEKKRSIVGEEPSQLNRIGDLSQEEFVRRVRDLRRVLLHKWAEEKRLDCIKLITEVARLLSSLSVPHFYPSLFVHVTDTLDIFGELVYQRLLSKAKEERAGSALPPLTTHFNTSDVLELTRITARNWFGKIAAIKELIPRLYVEAACLRCMRFMDETAISANVMRLCTMARSIQHPLVSGYARCYVARIAMRLDPADRAPHWRCLNDWMQTYAQQPSSLLWPALEYVIQCVSFNAVTYDDLGPLWEYCRLPAKRSVILRSMLNAVPSLYLAEHALEACKIVTSSDAVTADEISAFGASLLKVDVGESIRKPILRAIWKSITRLSSLQAYMACCDVWVEFAARYFTVNELHIILESVIRKLLPEKRYESYYRNLSSILRKVFDAIPDTAQILNMDVFTQFMDMFRDEPVRKQSAQLILEAFVARHRTGVFSDLNLAHQVIDVCKRLHDSVGAYSAENDVDEAARLIQAALDRFSLDADPEQALTFLVSCRAALMNIDQTQKYIVLRIIALSLYVIRSAKYSSSRSAFLQACLANLYITIPSLSDPLQRLQLNVQSTQVAFAALAFLQVDAFLEATLDCFDELEPPHHAAFRSHGVYFLSQLAQIPTFDEDAPLSVFRRFLAAVEKFQWPSSFHADRSRLLLACLQYLFAVSSTESSSVCATFEWSNVSASAEQQAIVDECIDHVVELLLPTVKNDSTERPLLSIEFLEVFANYDGNVSHALRSVAKEAYRRCKHSSHVAQRLQSLRFNE